MPDISTASVFMEIHSSDCRVIIDMDIKCKVCVCVCTQRLTDTSRYFCFKARKIYEQAEITRENDQSPSTAENLAPLN